MVKKINTERQVFTFLVEVSDNTMRDSFNTNSTNLYNNFMKQNQTMFFFTTNQAATEMYTKSASNVSFACLAVWTDWQETG